MAFIDHYANLYKIVRHQFSYIQLSLHSMHITSYRTLDTIILVLQCFNVPPWRCEHRTFVREEYCISACAGKCQP